MKEMAKYMARRLLCVVGRHDWIFDIYVGKSSSEAVVWCPVCNKEKDRKEFTH